MIGLKFAVIPFPAGYVQFYPTVAESRTTSGVSSVDALSDTSIRNSWNVWARTLSIDSFSQAERLKVGMPMVTRGGDFIA